MASSTLKNHEVDSDSDSSDAKSVRISDRGSEEGDNHEVRVVEISPKGRFRRFNTKLGTGAYKTVYLAFDNDTGNEVAWNVISFARLKRNERKRIDEEIQIAKSLDHPRIIRFINAWINKEKAEVIFITERVTGGSLRHYINRLDGPLKLKVIRNWCRQILEGVVYLHSQPHPVIHRDLKCDNIFVQGNDGKVLIGDLGLSTALRAASCATSIVGTPEFMAPELYEEKYGPAVDIYAFGMCLLEMVTRSFPYAECTTAGQIYKKVISGERPKSLNRIKDSSLRGIIEKCIINDPEKRPTAEELLADPFWSMVDDGDNLAEVEPENTVTPTNGIPNPITPPVIVPSSPIPTPINSSTNSGAARNSPSGAGGGRRGRSTQESPRNLPLPTAVIASPIPIPLTDLIHQKSQTISSPISRPHAELQASSSPADLIFFNDTTVTTALPRSSSQAVFSHTSTLADLPEESSVKTAPPFLNPFFPSNLNHVVDVSPVLGQSYRPPTREALEMLPNLAQLESTCRYMEIGKLTNVKLTVELTSGRWHTVSFDFSLASDSALTIAGELREAGLVWEGVSDATLVEMVNGALQERLHEIAQERRANQQLISLTTSSSNAAAMKEVGSSDFDHHHMDGPGNFIDQSGGYMAAAAAVGGATPPSVDLLSNEDIVIIQKVLKNDTPGSNYLTPQSEEFLLPSTNKMKIHPFPEFVIEKYKQLSEEICHHLLGSYSSFVPKTPITTTPTSPGLTAASLATTPASSSSLMTRTLSFTTLSDNSLLPPLRGMSSTPPTSEDVFVLQQMLSFVFPDRKNIPFLCGAFCQTTSELVKAFQSLHGLDITGVVCDPVWDALVDEVDLRKKKEWEKQRKREEAKVKAKQENEKKLLQQQEESAKALDNIMEKTLNSIGLASSGGVTATSSATATPTPPAKSLNPTIVNNNGNMANASSAQSFTTSTSVGASPPQSIPLALFNSGVSQLGTLAGLKNDHYQDIATSVDSNNHSHNTNGTNTSSTPPPPS